jgi:hypothetical protein
MRKKLSTKPLPVKGPQDYETESSDYMPQCVIANYMKIDALV